jgi:filamentous hemagglutinin family protein
MDYRRLLTTTSLVALLAAGATGAFANPKGGEVVGGSATINSPDSSTLHIDQSTDKAIIDWQSFDIAPDETTQFFQPDRTSVTLNRVVGSQDPSQILGALKANGTVMIVNPDGILFGKNSKIDVGGLLATTSDIRNEDFMAGRYDFSIPGNPAASIVNLGKISIQDTGIAALVAPGVRNEGVIAARLGSVSLAAANTYTLDFYGDDLINFELTDVLAGEVIDVETGEPLSDRVANRGTLKADGGTVALTASTARKVVNSVVNNTGVVEANTVGMDRGKIVLGAQTADTKVAEAPAQTVKVSGTLAATGEDEGELGGTIVVTGEDIDAFTASLDASAWAGDGTILIGGDYMGGNPDPQTIAEHEIKLEDEPILTAASVDIAEDVTISTDATDEGEGGKVIVWSDVTTIVHGLITSRGGPNGGDAGFIETSGKYLEVTSTPDASAPKGKAGTWLLDPYDLVILDSPSSNLGTGIPLESTGDVEFYPTGSVSQLSTTTIATALNAGTDVSIRTADYLGGTAEGDIYV